MDDEKIRRALGPMTLAVSELIAPADTAFVLVDLDPTQFMTDSKDLYVVDTEAYVIAPRELDFIALEYVLDKASAEAFTDGYTSILDIPDLSKCREPYRYLYRLLEVQDAEDLDDWLSYPALF